MREFFRTLVHALEAGQPVVLVSILTSRGSTPRGTGAMMGVLSDGTAVGTVGGGSAEFAAQQAARELLPEGENIVRDFRFVQGDQTSQGMVCGGDVRLHFQVLTPQDTEAIAALRSVIAACGHGTGVWLVRKLEGARVTTLQSATGDQRDTPALTPLLEDMPVLTEDGWFSVPVERPGTVYLFGGGHVSQALVAALAPVGFRTVVFDDRPEFTTPERFPQAAATLWGDFTQLSQQIHVTADDYVVIMTRGHQADYEVLAELLRSGAKYLGCIGSKRKLSLCRDRLMAAGFTPEEYALLHAPIGLPIGAQTPEEIAVSVAAELIAVRSGVSK